MGAKLMTEGGEKTAEEARINASSQTSALDMVVSLWDSVVNAALKACAKYKAVDPDLVSLWKSFSCMKFKSYAPHI